MTAFVGTRPEMTQGLQQDCARENTNELQSPQRRLLSHRVQQARRRLEFLARESRELDDRIAQLRERAKFTGGLPETAELITRRDSVAARSERFESRLREIAECLRTKHLECEERRDALGSGWESAAQDLDEFVDCFGGENSPLADALQDLQLTLPTSADEDCHWAAVKTAVEAVRDAARERIVEAESRSQTLHQTRGKAQAKRNRQRANLDRWDRNGHILPAVPRLAEAIEALTEAGIEASLLYQLVEFQPGVSTAQQQALESFLGLRRLTTLVTSAQDAANARQIVAAHGSNLRVLEAEPQLLSGHVEIAKPSLMSCVQTRDSRAETVLRNALGPVRWIETAPQIELQSAWVSADGWCGRDGLRWKLEMAGPKWIGTQMRRTSFERVHAEAESAASTAAEQFERADAEFSETRRIAETTAKIVWWIDSAWLERLQTQHRELIRVEQRMNELGLRASEWAAEQAFAEAEATALAELIEDSDGGDDLWDELASLHERRGACLAERKCLVERIAEWEQDLGNCQVSPPLVE